MSSLVRKLIRSPHILEVFGSYGLGTLLQLYFVIFIELASFSTAIAYVGIGLIIYTFLEYWFHRIILHNFLEKAHNNHHSIPRNLKIIATPIIPVHIYDLFFIHAFHIFFPKEVVFGVNVGISIGQSIMDTVHILFHTQYRPWYLESARSYHLHHHFVDGQSAHGLTTSFWDLIFGTFPKNWCYNKKYPWIVYFQLPFPVIGFALISLFCSDETKRPSPELTPRSEHTRIRPHGSANYLNVFLTTLSAVCVVCTPYLL